MKRVVYTKHLLYRLEVRGITRAVPEQIVRTATERYFDTSTEHFVAVKQVWYLGKIRDMMVAYQESKTIIELITIHPLKQDQKDGRLSSGRWIAF